MAASQGMHSDFARFFSDHFADFLEGLSESFSDCASTVKYVEVFHKHLKGQEVTEEILITRWHKFMKPHYRRMLQQPLLGFDEILEQLSREASDGTSSSSKWSVSHLEKNLESAKSAADSKKISACLGVLCDPVYFLRQLRMRDKWRDPTFDADSKSYIVCYMLHLNGFAIMHATIPQDLSEAMRSQGKQVAEDKHMQEMFQGAMGNLGSGNGVNANTVSGIQDIFRSSCNQLPKGSLKEFVNNLPVFLLGVSSLAGAGLPDGNLLARMLESNKSLMEKIGPLENILRMVLPMVGNAKPETFDNLAKVLQSPKFQDALFGPKGVMNNGELPAFDPAVFQGIMNPQVLTMLMQQFSGQQQQQQQQGISQNP